MKASNNRFWIGDNLWHLLNDSTDELIERYPGRTRKSLRDKRSKYKKLISRGGVKMPEKPKDGPQENGFDDILRLHHLNPETLRELSEQGFHVGYIKNSEGEIEYTLPLPNAKGRKRTEPDWEPAQSARITPSRRKPIERDYKLLYVFSDAQIDYRRLADGELVPIHDERALRVGRLICADLQPDEIINLGDTVDLAVLSRFKPDSDHFHRTLGPSFQRVHDYYAELRSDNPNAKITEVDSNHNTRLKDFALKNAPAMYGMKQAGAGPEDYPVLTYPFLANLGHLGVNWISGYGAAEYVYGAEYGKPPIVFKHGTMVASNGSTALKESKDNPETHIVRGHGHRLEMHHRTNRAGHYLASIMIGASCSITGEVPSYHSAVDDRGRVVKQNENWQQSVLVIYDYQDGHYQFDNILISDGIARYNGKEYKADE